jgi:hypothetical protein
MAARAAHITPVPQSVVLANRVVDAIDDIEPRLLALEALEQLIAPQMAGTKEDLSHVDRAGFAWLLTIINVDMRQQLTTARATAETAGLLLKGGQA